MKATAPVKEHDVIKAAMEFFSCILVSRVSLESMVSCGYLSLFLFCRWRVERSVDAEQKISCTRLSFHIVKVNMNQFLGTSTGHSLNDLLTCAEC